MAANIGKIAQIIGPVVDVRFTSSEEGETVKLPKIHEAMTINRANGKRLTLEVEQHIGENTVRCVAMDSTDGLSESDLDCSIRNLGRLGKDGMNQTDDMILDIMTHKR